MVYTTLSNDQVSKRFQPIHRLPFELLGLIFILGADTYRHPRISSLKNSTSQDTVIVSPDFWELLCWRWTSFIFGAQTAGVPSLAGSWVADTNGLPTPWLSYQCKTNSPLVLLALDICFRLWTSTKFACPTVFFSCWSFPTTRYWTRQITIEIGQNHYKDASKLRTSHILRGWYYSLAELGCYFRWLAYYLWGRSFHQFIAYASITIPILRAAIERVSSRLQGLRWINLYWHSFILFWLPMSSTLQCRAHKDSGELYLRSRSTHGVEPATSETCLPYGALPDSWHLQATMYLLVLSSSLCA